MVPVVARHGAVHRTAVPPDGRADRTDARAARALLLPQFLAGARYFPAHFGLRRAGARRRLRVPYSLVKQRFIDFTAEHFIGQFQFAHLVIAEIDYVYCWHRRYLFALRPTT